MRDFRGEKQEATDGTVWCIIEHVVGSRFGISSLDASASSIISYKSFLPWVHLSCAIPGVDAPSSIRGFIPESRNAIYQLPFPGMLLPAP